MSEQTSAPEKGEQDKAPEPAEQQQGDPAEDSLGDRGKRAIAAEREARRAAEDALKAFKQQVENERLSAQKQLQEAEEAAAKAATEALRWRTAAKFGISDEDAETFLTGTDEATITRQAERLAEFQKAQQDAPAGPRPDLTQGSKSSNKPSDPAAAFAAAFADRL